MIKIILVGLSCAIAASGCSDKRDALRAFVAYIPPEKLPPGWSLVPQSQMPPIEKTPWWVTNPQLVEAPAAKGLFQHDDRATTASAVWAAIYETGDGGRNECMAIFCFMYRSEAQAIEEYEVFRANVTSSEQLVGIPTASPNTVVMMHVPSHCPDREFFVSYFQSLGCTLIEPQLKKEGDETIAKSRKPCIRPELKKQVDEMIALYPLRPILYENKETKILPWKVGQWVLVKQVDELGNYSISRIGIVKQEGSAFWIEISTTTYFDKNDAAILIDGFDANDLSKVRILKMKMRDEKGNVTELTEDQITFASPASFVYVLKQMQADGTKEAAIAPAGVFEDAVKTDVKITTPVSASCKGDFWRHSAVPILGYAKSFVIANRVNTIHEWVLDFGNEGAKSVFK